MKVLDWKLCRSFHRRQRQSVTKMGEEKENLMVRRKARVQAGERNGNPLQVSPLENPMDRGAWRATVPGVTKSWTWLSNLACTQSPNRGTWVPRLWDQRPDQKLGLWATIMVSPLPQGAPKGWNQRPAGLRCPSQWRACRSGLKYKPVLADTGKKRFSILKSL